MTYCTLFSKLANVLNVQDIDEQGKLHNLLILPDYNINVNANIYAKVKKHPMIQMLLESGQLQEIQHLDAKIKGEALGLKIADTPLKEGAMLVDQNLVNDQNLKFTPSKDKLKSYHGVTNQKANAILKSMPAGGWTNKQAFLDDPNVSKYEIDWSPSNMKPEQVL
jgi:hypothetical protein